MYLDADLLKSEGDVLRDAERALLLARGRPLDSHPAVEAAADLVWDEVQVTSWANIRPNDAVVPHCRPGTADPHRVYNTGWSRPSQFPAVSAGHLGVGIKLQAF